MGKTLSKKIKNNNKSKDTKAKICKVSKTKNKIKN